MNFGGNYNNNYDNDYGNNNYGNSNYSSQLMVDKQKQSLKYSYETLGNLLSAAENFAGLANEKYGSYNYSKSTDYNSLKSEFAWELDCFNLAIQTYQKKYGPYKFPPDCPKEKILKDIQIYMQRTTNNKDKMLYHMMADIISGKKVSTDFKNLYEELDENANRKFDPRKMNQIVGPLNQILDQAENDAEKGNMNLLNRNKATEKAKEQLKNISNEYPKKIEVLIGEKGILILSQNHLYFISNMNDSKKIHIAIDPSKLKQNTFYIINRGILLVSMINKNQASCVMFIKENMKTVTENSITKRGNITLNNTFYTYGTYVDSKRNKFDVIFQSEEDDLK